MSAANASSNAEATRTDAGQLPGDICPPWCGQSANHAVMRGGRMRHEHEGVGHGLTFASWPSTEAGMTIDIDLHAYRHDRPERDRPDHVLISGPGDDGDRPTQLTLTIEDAMRLRAELSRLEDAVIAIADANGVDASRLGVRW